MKPGSSAMEGAALESAFGSTAGPDVRQLYEEHGRFVQRAVAHMAGPDLDPEDLVQDVFVQVCRRWASFQGRSSIETWLYGVTLGVVRNARRRARFRRFLGLDRIAERPSLDDGPVETLERRDAQRQLHALLDQLSDAQRTVLVLFELEGLKGEQIAAILGCSQQVVWNRLFKARQSLKQKHAEGQGRPVPRRSR